MELFLHLKRGEETRAGTLSSRAQEDLKKHLRCSEQMMGATALDISRLRVRDFWSKPRQTVRVFCNLEEASSGSRVCGRFGY